MRATTPDDVFAVIDGYVGSAAVGAAMEHGVFWLLSGRTLAVEAIAAELGVAEARCVPWLEVLAGLGLLDRHPDGYSTSETARSAIVEANSRETWAFLAREARERVPAVRDLAVDLPGSDSPWDKQGIAPPDYLAAMRDDPNRAREFTRMLYEIHLPLAETLAAVLPGEGATRLLDVGGGSGVMSFGLLRRHPGMMAVVLDMANVCAAGKQIAVEVGMADRVEYRPGDFATGTLPTGFDLLLFCDVGPYQEDLFRRFLGAVEPGGRLAVVGKFGIGSGRPHPSRSHWALLGALAGPAAPHPTAAEVVAMLDGAGFTETTLTDLPPAGSRWDSGWTLLIARRS